ncbi:rod shape-determining protein RodA [Algiphilus sp.]|uniref:rod shape-determining protein RodA n=1 Tax=Algiphilus sp. TaxID=1872431 RepID=UPI0025B8B93A|nr:rod shape-determining protein RodA [Algiphilus sp.]MCI5063955.1 rod shape-determining protein RodA [Algiphilus sp.]MCI5104577.1 rod shape-determining protein RodA [Algiphilus sp.]MCR9091256.1 rod shape-determining protein RodA [Pseudomonadota bacterium]
MNPLSAETGRDNRSLGFFARHYLDGPLLALIVMLLSVSLATLYSATGNDGGALWSQLKRLSVGLAVLVVCARIPPDGYRAIAPAIYAGTLLLLVLVLVFGDASKGAQRWLDLGIVRFQPSELMKLAMPMAVAAYLHATGVAPGVRRLPVVLLIIALPAALVGAQPDLGTALMITMSGLIALYLGGLRWRWMLGFAATAMAAIPLLWFNMHDYQRSRVLTFLNPERDPLGAGYHITQSKIAIGSGGALGKGWGEGTQARLDFLPESHTDFIFAAFAEETGLIGAGLLLLLYFALTARCLIIALRGQETFQRLLGGSLGIIFFCYVFINIGMVCGLLPVVGVPLPLMSFGGTSIVSLMAGFGILMSIQTHRKLVPS